RIGHVVAANIPSAVPYQCLHRCRSMKLEGSAAANSVPRNAGAPASPDWHAYCSIPSIDTRARSAMKRKPANLPRGDSMNAEERAVEQDARRESWLTKILRNTRLAKGRPPPRKRADR